MEWDELRDRAGAADIRHIGVKIRLINMLKVSGEYEQIRKIRTGSEVKTKWKLETGRKNVFTDWIVQWRVCDVNLSHWKIRPHDTVADS